MKILPKIHKMSSNTIGDNTELLINENITLTFKNTSNSDNNVLLDLIENKAYATTLLYLNENYELEVEKSKNIFTESDNIENSINDYLDDCNELLHTNIKIVEAKGPLLTSIKNYPIYESELGILRGIGVKKILESFSNTELETLAWDLVNFMKDFDTYEFNDSYDSAEDAYDQAISDLSNKKGIESIENALNSVKEEVNSEFYSLDDLESLLDRLNKLKETLNESTNNIDLISASYEELNSVLDELITKNATDKEFNDFIETIADNEVITNKEYNTLLNKAQDTRRIDEDGTQCSDIAGKTDQELGINIPQTTTKKKYYDILLSGINEGLPFINRGFFKNDEGQYQRGNYIIVKEGDKYLAINKNKLKGGK